MSAGDAGRQVRGCSESCPYRKLYEGSQRSLADMSARQEEASARLGRFRNGVLAAFRKAMPRMLGEAERGLGRSLAELTDDALVAQLDLLLVEVSERLRALGSLREALEGLGLELGPSEDPADWAQALSVQRVLRGRPPEAAERGLDDLEEVFADPAPAGPPGLLDDGGPGREDSPVRAAGEAGDGGPPDPFAGLFDGLESIFDESEPAPGAAGSGRPPDPPAPDTARKALRPQLFPTEEKTRRRKRKASVKAVGWTSGLDVPDLEADGAQEAGGCDPDRMWKLVESAPGPVFVADLAPAAGSWEAADDWRRTDRRVRSVPAKPRHRGLGALVFPASHDRRTLWGECLERLRGPRLYEVAVLLRKFVDDMVGYQMSNDVVRFRVASPGGVVGVVVVVGTDLEPGGGTAEEVLSAVEEMMRERLGHLAVLVTNAEHAAPVTALLERAEKEREWKVTVPVLVAKSWEYVDGASAALPVLGL